jgi:CheY-like chemotaxis protein
MRDQVTGLQDVRVLVVEDEYLVALALSDDLEEAGAIVVGPASSIEGALELIAQNDIEVAVLDIQLHTQIAFPVADALIDKGVPFLFTTGFDAGAIPDRYAHVPKSEKPASGDAVLEILVRLAGGGD